LQNETLFGRREKKAAFYGSPEDKKSPLRRTING
jgi:hypothetical protein